MVESTRLVPSSMPRPTTTTSVKTIIIFFYNVAMYTHIGKKSYGDEYATADYPITFVLMVLLG